MAGSQAQEDLFTLVAAPQLDAEQARLLALIEHRPMTADVQVARLSSASTHLLQKGAVIRVSVAPAASFVAVGRTAASRAPGHISWSGPLQDDSGWVQLVLSPTGVTGTLRSRRTLYRIEPLGGGLHAIVRVDPTKFPSEDAPHEPSDPSDGGRGAGGSAPLGDLRRALGSLAATPSITSATSTRIKVLVAYTPAVAQSVADIGSLIDLAIDETNTSYANSGIDATLALAYAAQVSYSEAGHTYAQHVGALQSPSDGVMDIVHSWRNGSYADVVVLLVDDPAYCGMASQVGADASTAFAAVYYACATGNYSFGHEIGHLQGARHDRETDPTSTPYADGHGYIAPDDAWRTIMAYPGPCGGCVRLQYWSNPNVSYAGQAMGTVTYENNARVLNYTKGYVANFRYITTSISGPSLIDDPGTYTWTANYSGSGTPTYQWTVRYEDGFQQSLGTGQSQSFFASDWQHTEYLFDMIVTVTVGDETATASERVYGP